MSLSRMNIATALNSKYMRYAYVMLTSLFMNQGGAEIHVYLLNNDLTSYDRDALTGLGEKFHQNIHFLQIDRDFFPNELPVNSAWTLEAYFRLMLLDILPEEVDRLLYLDVDIIVDKSIHDLYFTDFGNSFFCVCRDAGVRFPLKDVRNELFREHVKKGFTYFNSGVMLWNISDLRKRYNFKFYMNLIKQLNYKVLAPDQDLLNFAHYNQITLLDEYRYNLFSKMSYYAGVTYADVKRETVIVHFAGQKPWQGDCIHYEIERLWWDYAKLTPFYHELLEESVSDCIMNNSVFDTVRKVSDEKQNLYEELQKSSAMLQSLMGLLKTS